MNKKNLNTLRLPNKKIFYPLSIILSIVFIDLFSKYLVIHVFHFSYSINYGIPLGIFSQRIFSSVFSFILYILLFTFLILFWFYSKSNRTVFIFLMGGGLSNIFDRLLNYGGVVDWIPFFGFTLFNLADLAIFSSMVLLLYEYIILHHIRRR